MGCTMITILQMKKLRFREVKWIAKGAEMRGDPNLSVLGSILLPYQYFKSIPILVEEVPNLA